MHILNKDTPFIWDERSQESFKALKKALVSTPLLNPSNYSRDYFLYMFVSKGTVGMVLIQEEDELHDHIVYYLSKKLFGPKLKYYNVEKLSLAIVNEVQRLQNYIFL
jgi:hypothetical protein